VLKFQNKMKSKIILFVSFAAGVLLGAAFINIIPEAIHFNPDALTYVLVSILFLYIIEQRISFHTCHDEECEGHSNQKGIFWSSGLGFHSLLDGIIIGAGFEASYSIGIIATLGILMHKFPAGISLFSMLLHDGYKKSKALTYSIYVALATPLGAIISLLFLKNINQNVLGIFLAIAGGTFIYIGATDLIPETHKKLNNLNVPFVLLGAFIIYLAHYII